MGRMKEYAMWQEEKGYLISTEEGYEETTTYPGDAKVLSEYLDRKKGMSVVRVKEVRSEKAEGHRIHQILWKVNGSCVVSSSSTKTFDGDELVNETMFFLATGNGTITSHSDLHVMYPAEFCETRIAVELHRWAAEEVDLWTGDDNENE